MKREFNVEQALKLGRAQTTKGNLVTQLTKFELPEDCDLKYVLAGVIHTSYEDTTDGLNIWTITGNYYMNGEGDKLDLVTTPAPVKTTKHALMEYLDSKSIKYTGTELENMIIIETKTLQPQELLELTRIGVTYISLDLLSNYTGDPDPKPCIILHF